MTTTMAEPKLDKGPTDLSEVAHIVDQRDPANDVGSAIVFGHEVEALCGHRWVPYRAPEGRPVCDECVDAYGQITN